MSLPSGNGSGAGRRVVIVVPRHEQTLYEYLKRSFVNTRNVEVVLERRNRVEARRPAVATEQRNPRSARLSGLAGVLIHEAPMVDPEPHVVATRAPKRRLWPALRVEDFTLITPDPDDGPASTPTDGTEHR